VVSPDVSGTLSLNLTRVPWRQALRTVVTSAGLVFARGGRHFYVHTAAWQREQRERSEQEQARRQLDAPLVTQGIPFLMPMPGSCKSRGKTPEPKGKFIRRQTHQPAADSG
jgi:protein transport protein HofQ